MHKTVLMECNHHVVVNSPEVGSVHYCIKCNCCKSVVKVIPELLVLCLRCRYRRRNNAGEFQARRVAARHINATGHGMSITQEGVELFRFEDQTPLPSCDLIPF